MRSLVLFICSHSLKSLIHKRSQQQNMSIPVYLKYLAIKDIEKTNTINEPDT